MKTRHAFTLVELVLAMACTSLLLLGISSAIVVASRSAFDPRQPQAALARSRSVAQLIADDLAQATSIVEGTATAIEFTVADRDDDGAEETIRYEWSGTVGDGIFRSFNTDSALLAGDIASLALTYTTTLEEATVIGDPAEGAEQLLYAYEDANLSNVPISSTSWLAMTILPTLPSDATAWSVTRLCFEAKQDGAATGTLTIKIKDWVDSGSWLWKTTIAESTLPSSYGWTTVPVSGVSGLTTSYLIAITFENAASAAAARMKYCDACEAYVNVHRSSTSTAWTNESYYADGALNLKVYGTITRPARIPSTITRVIDAKVAIVSYDASRSAGQASASIAARPILDITAGVVGGAGTASTTSTTLIKKNK